MKKIIAVLTFVLIILVPGLVLAEIGIKVGTTRTFFYFSPETITPWDPATGYQVGGFFNIHISNRLRIQPELVYLKKLGKSRINLLENEIEKIHAFSYIQLPASFILSWPLFKKIRFNVFAGGYIGLNVSAFSSYEFREEIIKYSIKSDVKKWDLGFFHGAGIQFELSTFSIFVEIRHHFRSNEMIRESYIIDSIKNNVTSFLLGIGF